MRHITLGYLLDTGAPVRVPVADGLGGHVLVTGATGAGKSLWIGGVIAQLLAGADPPSVIVVDMKGSLCEETRNFQLIAANRQLDPSDILSFSLSKGVAIPLDPLVPVPGLEPAIQAIVVAELLSQLSDPFGARMVNLARALVQAVMAVKGSLIDVRALLVDTSLVSGVIGHIADSELRHYLGSVFPSEPQASRDSLRARIDNVLAHPGARAMLCCGRSTPAAAFLESPLTLLDLGGSGVGSRGIADFVAGLVFMMVSTAIYTRVGHRAARHAFVVIDEWQRVAKLSAFELEDLLATSRSSRVSFALCNQYSSQISSVSPSLLDGVRANVAMELLFRPDRADLRHLEPYLPTTGRVVDSSRPDRLLSPAAERDFLDRRIGRLRPREAVLVNRLAGHAAVIRTPTLPVAEAERAWQALSQGERTALLRGRTGAPPESFGANRAIPTPDTRPPPPAGGEPENAEEADDAPHRPRRGRRTRSRVVP